MSERNDGGPAFPCEWDYIKSNRAAANGMNLRDYFAAKAMHAVLGMPDEFRVPGAGGVAQLAYQMADAMLAARSES